MQNQANRTSKPRKAAQSNASSANRRPQAITVAISAQCRSQQFWQSAVSSSDNDTSSMEFDFLYDSDVGKASAEATVSKRPSSGTSAKGRRADEGPSGSVESPVYKRPAGHPAAGVATPGKRARCVSWPESDLQLTKKPLNVGTHYSGMETIGQSFLALRIAHSLQFSCDSDPMCREFIQANFKPAVMYEDVAHACTQLDLDFYTAGPPCPPFSFANQDRAGLDDPRGQLLLTTVEWIGKAKPRTFLLEQVQNLKLQFPTLFNDLLKKLTQAGYKVSWKFVNTWDHAIPQNRPRVYVAGIRLDCVQRDKPFTWPKKIDRQQVVPLTQVLTRKKKRQFRPRCSE